MYISTFLVFFASAFMRSALCAPNQPEFYDPHAQGGSMLNNGAPLARHVLHLAPNVHIGLAGYGMGEPLNVIISGYSAPSVLTNAGFLGFAKALGFATECFGIHMGDPQSANLGDGHGWVNQTMEIREDYGSTVIGTCWESLAGGNHLRVYRQDGNSANSGALFLAVSKEENVIKHHMISPDGYNIGRDLLVQRATKTNYFNGIKYTSTARSIQGLMAAGTAGVNHGIATDGVVVLLTVSVG